MTETNGMDNLVTTRINAVINVKEQRYKPPFIPLLLLPSHLHTS